MPDSKGIQDCAGKKDCLGDKIAISGMVRDNHHMLSQSTFEHTVTIQIITNGELIVVRLTVDGKVTKFRS